MLVFETINKGEILKKFISLFLVFSLMILPVNLYSKARRGATLSVLKIGGQKIEGVLIAVKEDSLLLLDPEFGDIISVNIKDIDRIRFRKESKFWTGAAIGFSIGAFIAAITGTSAPQVEGILKGIAVFGGIGALLGAIIGTRAGTDETIQIEGMTDSEIQEALDKLRKKARIREYK